MKHGNRQDFWCGVLFLAIGLGFALIAYGVKFGDSVLLPGYSMGTPARMGPAFFPFYLGVMLALLGIIIMVLGLRLPAKAVEKFHWGPIGWVLGAVVMFGLLLKVLGMPLAGMLLVIVSSFGSHEFKWRPVLFLGLGLVIFCTAVFVYGLKLPVPLCPAIEALQELRMCRF